MQSSSQLPQVAIIGRPNVGKSTLFNVLTRQRKAVVKNQPGVTRDVLIGTTSWWGKSFDVIDTGGLTESKDTISQLIREQVVSLIKGFDLLVVVMDGRTGLVPEDRDVVRLAIESGRPFVIVVNKVDSRHKADLLLSEFYEFGQDVFACSFEQRQGVDEVVEWITERLPEKTGEETEGVKIALVGKPNVGKSTLCNRLIGANRMLVSDIAGTTVDSVESLIRYGDKEYILVDTAGLRRPSKRSAGIEKIAAHMSHSNIEKSDIVLLMVDGREGVTHQDARIIEFVLEQHKAVILVANKLDLAKEEVSEYRKWFREKCQEKLHFFVDIPIVFISAKSGAGLKDLFQKVDEVWEKLNCRISTSKLNDFFYDVIRKAPSPVYGTRNVKFYYVTQTKQRPPAFIAFANHPSGVTPAYRRFVTKNLQKEFGLQGVPLRLFVMEGNK